MSNSGPMSPDARSVLRWLGKNKVLPRFWAMPSEDTFTIAPIKDFVERYMIEGCISVDPFARNHSKPVFTNDINPETTADHHMDAVQFLQMLKDQKITADVVIFDPPYSPRQISEVYKAIGKKVKMRDTQSSVMMAEVRTAIEQITIRNSIVLSFGWNSTGMGKDGWETIELFLVCHGGGHNDTICMAQRKL